MASIPSVVLVLALASGLFAYAAGLAVRRHALTFGLIDVPNARSSHATPTPRGGGLGIVGGTIGGVLLLPLLHLSLPAGALAALVIGGLGVAGISLLDDIGGVPAPLRLLVHVGLGAGVVFLVGPVPALDLGLFGTVSLGPLAGPLTVLWIAGMINAYNFMDGIDGLAAGQSLATAGAWVVCGLLIGRNDLSAIGLLIAASSAGFLLHNWMPARLFMGDVGSAFLGYTLGLLAVIGAQESPRLATAGVVFLWPFVIDTALTLARRVIRRENVLAAHRSHFYQRLIATGWTHGQVLRLYLGLAAASAAVGVALAYGVQGSAAALSVLLPASAAAIWMIVHRRERQRTRIVSSSAG